MHSKDPNKQSGPLFDAFRLEFERILDEAGEGEAHFEHFVFPQLDLIGRKLLAICRFDSATFTQEANFLRATFTQKADFSGVIFNRNVDFNKATFLQNADFGGATFTQDANFSSATFIQKTDFTDAIFTQNAIFIAATFTQDANFSNATFANSAVFCNASFSQSADFSSATFTQDANFSSVIFTQNANFFKATFTRNADFSCAIFMQNAYFWNATFTQDAEFRRTTFIQDANFNDAIFTRDANFFKATFMQAANFESTEFHGTADWRKCRFLDQAEFRHTRFEPRDNDMPSAAFALAKFSKPSEIVFEEVDLSRVLFHNCDVSQVWFTSSVWWAKREGHRGLAVFEEEILLKPKFAQLRKDYGYFDYGAVEQIYHQLQKNYDTRLDYRKANDFHYGQMEMRRLEATTGGLFSIQPRFLRRWASLLNLYRVASDYGNSYAKPGAWLFAILLAAALLFPIAGLELKQVVSASSASVTYSSVWNGQDGWTNKFWAEAKLIGKSGITAIDTATFQRTPEYAPVYPWGRVLAIVETLLTSSLFALFLLAIRRQFRR
jgi:hypothetical protein